MVLLSLEEMVEAVSSINSLIRVVFTLTMIKQSMSLIIQIIVLSNGRVVEQEDELWLVDMEKEIKINSSISQEQLSSTNRVILSLFAIIQTKEW